jgi:hypothetical protein
MKHRILLISILALLLLLAVGLASARIAGYSLLWWTVDNGGGTSSGENYKLKGTIGQPDADTLSGGSYKLKGGFWGVTFPPPRLYLPLTMDNYYPPLCGPTNNYCEDNGTPDTAFGPLISGVNYFAYPNDDNDYYYISLPTSATATITVSNYQADGQLQLRNEQSNILAWDASSEDHILKLSSILIQTPGKYYIYIYSRTHDTNNLYTLIVTY